MHSDCCKTVSLHIILLSPDETIVVKKKDIKKMGIPVSQSLSTCITAARKHDRHTPTACILTCLNTRVIYKVSRQGLFVYIFKAAVLQNILKNH